MVRDKLGIEPRLRSRRPESDKICRIAVLPDKFHIVAQHSRDILPAFNKIYTRTVRVERSIFERGVRGLDPHTRMPNLIARKDVRNAAIGHVHEGNTFMYTRRIHKRCHKEVPRS